jgi:hypothetical protein
VAGLTRCFAFAAVDQKPAKDSRRPGLRRARSILDEGNATPVEFEEITLNLGNRLRDNEES